MSNSTPSEAVPNVSAAADRYWWAWRHYNPRQSADPHAAAVAAYKRGYRDCLADTLTFSNLQTSVERLVELLEEWSIEREAVMMATAAGGEP
jgi:hypothetical protein